MDVTGQLVAKHLMNDSEAWLKHDLFNEVKQYLSLKNVCFIKRYGMQMCYFLAEIEIEQTQMKSPKSVQKNLHFDISQ